MKLGVTGTQRGWTNEQALTFRKRLATLIREHRSSGLELHHGMCVGVDEQANAVAHDAAISRDSFDFMKWRGTTP